MQYSKNRHEVHTILNAISDTKKELATIKQELELAKVQEEVKALKLKMELEIMHRSQRAMIKAEKDKTKLLKKRLKQLVQ